MARAARPFTAALLAGVLAAPVMAQTERPWVDPPSAPEARGQPPDASERGPAAQQPSPPADAAAPAPGATADSAPALAVPAQPGEPAAPLPSARPAEGPPASRSAQPPADTAPDQRARVSPRPEERPPAEGVATQLAIEYLGFWSAPNRVTLDATPGFYAPRVEFHGRMISARALFDEKRRFVQRWPIRSYALRPETLQTTCSPSSEVCTVRTAFDFVAISPERGKRSEGTGNLELEISVAGEAPVIVAETSRVVRRGRSAASTALEDVDE